MVERSAAVVFLCRFCCVIILTCEIEIEECSDRDSSRDREALQLQRSSCVMLHRTPLSVFLMLSWMVESAVASLWPSTISEMDPLSL